MSDPTADLAEALRPVIHEAIASYYKFRGPSPGDALADYVADALLASGLVSVNPPCETCGGTGEIDVVEPGPELDTDPCPSCGGTGRDRLMTAAEWKQEHVPPRGMFHVLTPNGVWMLKRTTEWAEEHGERLLTAAEWAAQDPPPGFTTVRRLNEFPVYMRTEVVGMLRRRVGAEPGTEPTP